MKKTVIITALFLLYLFITPTVFASLSVDYGWEDGGTILGQYGNIESYNVGSPDPVYEGSYSLKLVDMSSSGPSTPQAYVAWITGLQDGDTVTASFWCYDTTSDTSPSARIWGHYTSSDSDINSYAGSASGNSNYSSGSGWNQLSYTWVFDEGYDRTGLVIEVRTYVTDGDTVWIDSLNVTAPDNAEIHIIPEPASLILVCIGGLTLIRKRRVL